jgi:hypothetical protein
MATNHRKLTVCFTSFSDSLIHVNPGQSQTLLLEPQHGVELQTRRRAIQRAWRGRDKRTEQAIETLCDNAGYGK